jgi:pimeloyl-ACP methyl ester carboxylesterase
LLIGHDWGGALAWTLAMREPSLIHRLVVCNLPHPACFIGELKRPAQALRSWYMALFQLPWLPEALLRFRGGQGAVEMILRSSRDRSRFPEDVCETYRRNAARPGGATAMLNWYRALNLGGTRAFPKIEIPTLLIWGSEDAALSIRTTRGTEAYVTNLTLRVLPGVSHWVQQEAPEVVNDVIEAWVTSLRQPST